jgi:beta-glucosidase
LWIDNPHVAVVFWAGLSTPEYGHVITDVLFGNSNPGGKLVFTISTF